MTEKPVGCGCYIKLDASYKGGYLLDSSACDVRSLRDALERIRDIAEMGAMRGASYSLGEIQAIVKEALERKGMDKTNPFAKHIANEKALAREHDHNELAAEVQSLRTRVQRLEYALGLIRAICKDDDEMAACRAYRITLSVLEAE